MPLSFRPASDMARRPTIASWTSPTADIGRRPGNCDLLLYSYHVGSSLTRGSSVRRRFPNSLDFKALLVFCRTSIVSHNSQGP